MKWVNDKERVPENSHPVHIEYTNGDAVFKKTGKFIGGKWYELTGERILFFKSLNWLDEKANDNMGQELSLMLYRAIKILGKKELFENDHKFIDQANQVIIKYSNPLDALRSQSPQTPIDREQEVQEDCLLDISTFAANNRYKSPTLKGETASFITDMPKLIEYIKSKYHITRK